MSLGYVAWSALASSVQCWQSSQINGLTKRRRDRWWVM